MFPPLKGKFISLTAPLNAYIKKSKSLIFFRCKANKWSKTTFKQKWEKFFFCILHFPSYSNTICFKNEFKYLIQLQNQCKTVLPRHTVLFLIIIMRLCLDRFFYLLHIIRYFFNGFYRVV